MLMSNMTFAQTSKVDELKSKIDERSSSISELEKEIEQYKKDLDVIGDTKQTLEKEVKILDTSRKKLGADINVTENKIDATEYTIEKLELEIGKQIDFIGQNKLVLAQAIRNVDEIESLSLIEVMLAKESLSDIWDAVENIQQFQGKIDEHLEDLRALKTELEDSKATREAEKNKLIVYRGRLSDQKVIVDKNKKDKDSLLSDTKNKESNYKNLLADRLAKKEALERELEEFEAQLKIEIDPNSLPSSGSGVLKWPLDEITITQYFGNTQFATRNPQVYNGNGHNGIDFRASVGTPIKSSGNGVVVDTGDTDIACNGVSYGKWVLVEHGNNLSTLYAHLSLIKATPGQQVSTGDILGYSGNTGYTTGPHLHFAVFASQAVKVDQYRSRVCGTLMKLPLSPKNGYLNPLSYL